MARPNSSGTVADLKESTYPEFFGPRRRAHLVVVAIEVGGRWSEETWGFLSELPLMRKCAEQAWRMRWRRHVGVRWHVRSLLDLPHSHGGDGSVPAAPVDGGTALLGWLQGEAARSFAF